MSRTPGWGSAVGETITKDGRLWMRGTEGWFWWDASLQTWVAWQEPEPNVPVIGLTKSWEAVLLLIGNAGAVVTLSLFLLGGFHHYSVTYFERVAAFGALFSIALNVVIFRIAVRRHGRSGPFHYFKLLGITTEVMGPAGSNHALWFLGLGRRRAISAWMVFIVPAVVPWLLLWLREIAS